MTRLETPANAQTCLACKGKGTLDGRGTCERCGGSGTEPAKAQGISDLTDRFIDSILPPLSEREITLVSLAIGYVTARPSGTEAKAAGKLPRSAVPLSKLTWVGDPSAWMNFWRERDGKWVSFEGRMHPNGEIEYRNGKRSRHNVATHVSALASPVQQDSGWRSQAADDVLAERKRQVEAEGWTPEHDDSHSNGEMAGAAACYALTHVKHWGAKQASDALWPWADEWWKPSDRRRDLVKAGALILAEIERLDRIASPNKGGA